MKLPPWDPKTDEDRRAFVERVHDELLHARLKDGIANKWRLEDLLFSREAAKRGYQVARRKRGRPFVSTPPTALQQAKEDAKRMPAIFQKLWRKRNRHVAPTRADIAAEIWSLTSDEKEALSQWLDKKGKFTKD